MKTIIQKVVVGGILKSKNKVLIIQRAEDENAYPGLWEVPSGKKEKFEKVQAALIREYFEETGIKVEVGIPVHVFNYNTERENDIRDVTQINFLVESAGPLNVKLSSEHQNFAWITKREIDNYNLSKDIRMSIRKSFKN